MQASSPDIKKIFRNPPVLLTDRLQLRAMRESDAADMFEYSKQEETVRYLLWPTHEDVSYTRSYLAYVQDQYKKGAFYDWAVVVRETNKMIGTGGFTKIEEKHKCAQIGYVLHPSFWNMGYGTEIARELLSFGFGALGLHRIEAQYMTGNERSRHVMDKCGMRFEGVARQSMFVKGAYKDIVTCAILRDEYFAHNPEKKYTLPEESHWYDLFR